MLPSLVMVSALCVVLIGLSDVIVTSIDSGAGAPGSALPRAQRSGRMTAGIPVTAPLGPVPSAPVAAQRRSPFAALPVRAVPQTDRTVPPTGRATPPTHRAVPASSSAGRPSPARGADPTPVIDASVVAGSEPEAQVGVDRGLIVLQTGQVLVPTLDGDIDAGYGYWSYLPMGYEFISADHLYEVFHRVTLSVHGGPVSPSVFGGDLDLHTCTLMGSTLTWAREIA